MKNLLLFVMVLAAEYPWTDAMLKISGASCLEELDEEEVERFEHLHRNKLDLNLAGRAQITASGLLDQFQTSSFLRYRAEYGDVLSFSELALISGFEEALCKALEAFVTLKSSSPPGHREKKDRVHCSITARGSARADRGTEVQPAYGIKTELSYGSRAELRWSSRTTYSSPEPGPGTISGGWYGRRAVGKVIAGHFAARFGQGLTQWSGFSLSGYTSLEAFRKNPGGLAATGSFSPELCGAGTELDIGDFCISAAASLKGGFRHIVNVSWTGTSTSIGLTSAGKGVGLDWRTSRGRFSTFGEASFREGPAALAGFLWKTGGDSGIALQIRYFHPSFKKDWSGAALGYQNRWLTLTADGAWHIADRKSQLKCFFLLHPEAGAFSPSLRANMRWRPQDAGELRLDLRGDLGCRLGAWELNGRYNALWCKAFAWLWYIEAGRSRRAEPEPGKAAFSVYARFSLFCVDNWDDRIYVYERDAPGNFNVPAYYGRGLSGSVVSGIKIGRRHSLFLRLGYVSYLWNLNPKPARFEAKFQYTVKI